MVRQVGEKQAPCSTDINFGSFEESIIQAIARANQIPSESLKLALPGLYSESQVRVRELMAALYRSAW